MAAKGWFSKKIIMLVLLAAGLDLALGALLAALDGTGKWFEAFLAYGLLLILVTALLAAVVRGVQADKQVLAAALSAFVIRLAVGVTLALLFPSLGYRDNQATLAGYIYKDAYVRDQQAWTLASSSQPLFSAFQGKYSGDQYGGLLALSAFVYRYLSPDAHRPFMILILAAVAAALGTLWLWKGVKKWYTAFGEQETWPATSLAICAAWIFALYPESVLLGGSQMREPFVTAWIALAFYGFSLIHHRGQSWLVLLGLAAILLFLFQSPVALVMMVILLGLLFLEPGRRLSWKSLIWIGGFALVGGILVFITWKALPGLQGTSESNVFIRWFQQNFYLQTYMLERVSGWAQRMINQLGANGFARIFIVSAYGMAQPVLPAALVVPAGAPIWQVIGIFRSVGWYMMAPLLIYGAVASVFTRQDGQWRLRVWLNLVVIAWILIAALNAGADQWDNPRYRTILLAWMAMLSAWTWVFRRRDPWFWRLIITEGIFLLISIVWYISRMTKFISVLDIWVYIVIMLVAGVIIFITSWAWDHWKRKHSQKI